MNLKQHLFRISFEIVWLYSFLLYFPSCNLIYIYIRVNLVAHSIYSACVVLDQPLPDLRPHCSRNGGQPEGYYLIFKSIFMDSVGWIEILRLALRTIPNCLRIIKLPI